MRLRYLLVLLAAAMAASAQGPASQVLVAANTARITHGDTIRLSAVSRDSAGTVRPNDAFVWAVSDGNVLAVDAQGNVTAKGLGVAQVFANVGSVRGALYLQVVPSSIEVTPGAYTMQTGDAVQFRARVLDRSGAEIPNINVTWDVVNMRLGTTVAAVIGRQGNASASGAGQFYVRARYNYSGQTSPFVPYVEGLATLEVKLKTSHAVREITATDSWSQTAVLRPRRTYVAANDKGQVAFQGSLNGVANGLFLWDNGGLRTVAASGSQGPIPTGFIYEFQNFALNNRGEILSRALVAGSNHGLLVASKEESNWYGAEGMYLGGIEAVSSFFTTRCSLSDSGEAVARATYRLTGETTTNTGLFRFRPDGSVDLIASTVDGLPGVKGVVTLENDFGITADGTVYFRATTPTGDNAIYRQSGYDAPVRVVGIGDTFGTVRITNLPGTTYLSFLVGPQGDLVTLATLSNNSTVLLHYPKGAATPRQTTYRSMYGVFAVRDGSVLWYGDSGKGVGLQIWKPDNSQIGSVAWNQQLAGDPIQNIDGAALMPNGDVVASVRSAKHPFALVRWNGSALEVLAESGTPLDTQAQLTFTGMVPGLKAAGNPLLQAAGDPWNIVEVVNGEAIPMIQHGETFDNNTVWFGISFNQARRSPSGDLYLFLNPYGANVPNYGVYKYNSGKVSQLMKYNMTWPDGTVQYTGNFYGVSDSGYVLASSSTSRTHSRLYLLKDAKPILITTNSQVPEWVTKIGDAGEVIGWDNAVVTETGRVMAQLRFRTTATALYLWEDGRWTEMATLNKTKLLDLPVTSFNGMKAVGNDIYATFSMAGGGAALARWGGDKWEVLVSQNDTSPTGQPMAGIGNFDVNCKGEIVFLSNSFSWPDLIFRKPNGDLSVVTYTFDFDTFRNQLIRFTDVDLRDDGRIYFVALDFADRYALFEATPK